MTSRPSRWPAAFLGVALIPAIVIPLASCNAPRDAVVPQPRSEAGAVELTSDFSPLVDGFVWARQTAISYVREGDPVGDWFEAALPGRHAFCMRDVSHQTTGALALGLADHLQNMLHKFAAAIAESRDWCGYWEIDRDDRPAPVDYRSDSDFWYNLPANFDVVAAATAPTSGPETMSTWSEPTSRTSIGGASATTSRRGTRTATVSWRARRRTERADSRRITRAKDRGR
jgi:hypothetical protein